MAKVELKLTYIGYKVHEYNPQYVGEEFLGESGEIYHWWVTANTKEWQKLNKIQKGDRVRLSATIENNCLTYVKIAEINKCN